MDKYIRNYLGITYGMLEWFGEQLQNSDPMLHRIKIINQLQDIVNDQLYELNVIMNSPSDLQDPHYFQQVKMFISQMEAFNLKLKDVCKFINLNPCDSIFQKKKYEFEGKMHTYASYTNILNAIIGTRKNKKKSEKPTRKKYKPSSKLFVIHEFARKSRKYRSPSRSRRRKSRRISGRRKSRRISRRRKSRRISRRKSRRISRRKSRRISRRRKSRRISRRRKSRRISRRRK